MAFLHTFSTLCIIRSSRSKNNNLPVYLRITVDGKRAEISTKEYVELEKWNRDKGRVKGNSQDVRAINKRLDTWETKVKEHYNDFIRDNKRLNAQVLKDAVLGIVSQDNDLLSFFKAHEQDVKSKINIDYSSGTHKNYISTYKHLKKFLDNKYRNKLITLKDLDYDFILNFENYLKLEAHNSNNGAIKHIQRLKKVVHLAIKRGKLSSNPFANYTIKKEKVSREFLSQEELDIITNKELVNPTLSKVRDIFIFICYTGLSYSDLAELSYNSINKGIDGGLWITINRKKTGVNTRIPLLTPALHILEKYKDNPEAVNKGTALPVLTNQKMNHYLKQIASKCKISKSITCHIGRHTFATTVTLSNNIPIETVSHLLGHTSLRTTQIYAKVIENKVSQDMKKLKGLFGGEESNVVNQ